MENNISNTERMVIMKRITATGSWGTDIFGEERWIINCSSILSELIGIAGRNVGNYSSDLFISWNEIENALKDKDFSGKIYKFGFRDNGIDHLAWIELNKDIPNYYSHIMKLTVEVKNEDIKMILEEEDCRPEMEAKMPPRYRDCALEDATMQSASDAVHYLLEDYGIEINEDDEDEMNEMCELISHVAAFIEKKAW